MLLILSGPSTVGKSFTLDFLCRYYGFKSLTPYTTRKARPTESEGVHYHFRSAQELSALTENFTRGFWAQPLGEDAWYGYTEHISELGQSPQNWVVQAYSDIAIRVRRAGSDVTLVFLDFATDKAMNERIQQRYGADAGALSDRLAHARHERSNCNKFDHAIRSDDPEEIARLTYAFALEKVVQAPSPAIHPGPLSDVDIKESLVSDGGLRVSAIENEILQTRIRGWSIDLALASRYYRVRRRLLPGGVLDLGAGDAAAIMSRFRECVSGRNRGIRLAPMEFILTSTVERLTVPDNMVCMISGRSSYSRIGISVELSQVLLQPGHSDAVPLQIRNNLPYSIVIYPGTLIVQAVFLRTVSPSGTPYSRAPGAKYLAVHDDVRSRYYMDARYADPTQHPPRATGVDWDGVAAASVRLSSVAGIASLFVAVLVQDPETIKASKFIAVASFSVAIAAWVAEWFRNRQRARK